MQIKFWGVRGSIPCPGLHTVKYGGNTACIELLFKRINRRIIIDAGSGIRDLGRAIVSDGAPEASIPTEIFLTHTHWDHIMGLPFFKPLYLPGTRLKIYGPATSEDHMLQDVLDMQFTYRYFPVRMTELASEIEYIALKEDRFDLGDGITLQTHFLNHPVLCLGYRFEYEQKIFCTVYDTEPFYNVFCSDPGDYAYDENMAREGDQAAREENQRLEAFYAGADLVVYDAQYTRQEYDTNCRGWGHTPCEYALDAAMRNHVKRLAFFHHEPTRTDEEIDYLNHVYSRQNYLGRTDCFFAREGVRIDL